MNSFDSYVYLVPVMGLIGLLYTLWKFAWVSKQDAGTDRMKEISNYIAEGAMAFLRAEWKILTYFGDTSFYFSHQVSTHVCCLGIDSTSHTGKKSDAFCTK